MTIPLRPLALALLALAAGLSASADYRIVGHFPIGGEGGYDYLRVDPTARRLFVAHGTRVEVLDADSGKILGGIAPANGVHGIAFAPESGHGFTSNGIYNTITMFDLRTLAPLAVIPSAGQRPDALDYDAGMKLVFVCNHTSGNVTAIDAASGRVAGTIALGGTLEEIVFDGRGRLFVNAEDRSTIQVAETRTLQTVASWPLAPGESPTGLAIDREHHRLFAACGNKLLVVLDSDSGRVVATVPIGTGPDGVAFDAPRGRIFVPARDGHLAIIREQSPDHYAVLQNLTTLPGCRTIAFDARTGRLFLPTGKFVPAPATTPGGPVRQKLAPGTFEVLVVGE